MLDAPGTPAPAASGSGPPPSGPPAPGPAPSEPETTAAEPPAPAGEDRRAFELLAAGRHSDPHRVLGRHGRVVRCLRPNASAVRVLPGTVEGAGRPQGSGEEPSAAAELRLVHPAGVWEGEIDDSVAAYHFEVDYPRDGGAWTVRVDDPYRVWPTLGDLDLHLFGEGRHRRLWEVLGAHPGEHAGMRGTAFALWAPNARAVRVVGDWNNWDGRLHPMRSLGASGVWELFVPGVDAGARYKYEMVTADNRLVLKADPMALAAEVPPATASVVAAEPAHAWGDDSWLAARAGTDLLHSAMSVYEVHLGSWRFTDDGSGGRRPLDYRELAEQLPEHVASLGFTHVELMPVAEHPFSGSWGYQVTGYYAPTSRFGSPDDFRALVDALHRRGIGVIVDWVPAHFPRDEFALARFDGTALYEHDDPRRGSHPDWGTLVFNYGRNEVRNFLVANALYWIEQFHVDALRVDAVASMLYLDYSRAPGEWLPNELGGRENLAAVAFLREVNEAVFGAFPGATVIAEESTAWPGVSRPTYLGGLGFGFKWNMGWMHDTLQYFSTDPLYRSYHQGELTFGLVYAWSENFVLPLSHDEVVHGKGSLLAKMPGDRWQQLANLRALYAWMWAHPGKQLVFMGAELAPEGEWDHTKELDWWIWDHWADHRSLGRLLGELNRLQREQPALWEDDFSPEGFGWIDAGDAPHSVLSFLRRRPGRPKAESAEPAAHPRWPAVPAEEEAARVPPLLACIANLTPVPHEGYRVGLPFPGPWRELLNTDAAEWGGTGMGNGGRVDAEPLGWHGQPFSAALTLPPLGVLWLVPGDEA
ncbi:MAG: 1,4-alpha-glucan branching protein GlgB [Actinomycetota bacterium]|nr:1,4-alpha-glucan branching protein GlgB [Actinomycetota bacterium]